MKIRENGTYVIIDFTSFFGIDISASLGIQYLERRIFVQNSI